MADMELDIPQEEQTAPPPPEEVNKTFEEPKEEVEAPAETPEEAEEAPKPLPRANQRIQAEINRRKEAEKALQELNSKVETMEERFQRLMADKDPVPELDDDPSANLDYRLREQAERLEAFQEQQRALQAQNEEFAKKQALVSTFQAEEAQMAEKAEDYWEVVGGLRDRQLAMWQSAGLSQQEASAKVFDQLSGVIQAAQENGVSAAEILYEMAKPMGPKPDPVQEVKKAQENVTRARSLGSRGSTSKKLTLADVANLSDSEFNAAVDGDNWLELFENEGAA